MSTTTTRNAMVKPGYADAADIAVLNTNYDTIDAAIAKCNYAGTAAPTANEDSGDGYSIGSVWIDRTNNNIYVAKTVTLGAAVWTLQALHNNFSATAAPTVNDDIDLHYAPGSMWVDTTNHNVYVCEVNTNGAAVWKQVNSATISGYVKQDGSTPLTADWDVGAYHITADHFVSDVADGGAAPYQTTSKVVCSNLNADLLDGTEAAAFALLAGRAGGQSIYGGTATTEDLKLYPTSKDATGFVCLPNGGLCLGTKATTATNGAIRIHEGAAGAPNNISFLDADGTTVVGTIYKDSSDGINISTGSYAVGLSAAASGTFIANGGVTVTKTPTDMTTNYVAYGATYRPTFTKDQTTTNYSIYSACFPEVRTGKTNSGNVYSFYTETMRNHNGAATDDGGTQTGLYAQQAFFGHYNVHADEAPLTTYCSGVRISPYYTTGTISNLYCLEISAPATGGTVTNNWGMYNAHTGNTYSNATYNRFQSTTGDRVIYVVQTSTTDPIADAWNTHSNEKYKNDLGTIDPDIDRTVRYEARKAVADRTLHTWTRKVDLEDPAHYEAMFPIEDDRERGPTSDPKPAKDLEVRQAEQDLAIYRHIEKCKTLKKFQKTNIGLFAEEAPEEIVSYGLDGQPEGIDLGAYIGWVHRAVDAMHYDLDFLEVDVADIDKMLWEKEAQIYALEKAHEESQAKINILEEKNAALLKKHDDNERRMALLEQRLAKLENL